MLKTAIFCQFIIKSVRPGNQKTSQFRSSSPLPQMKQKPRHLHNSGNNKISLVPLKTCPIHWTNKLLILDAYSISKGKASLEIIVSLHKPFPSLAYTFCIRKYPRSQNWSIYIDIISTDLGKGIFCCNLYSTKSLLH